MRDVEGTIERLGGRGDGVMSTPAGRLYVPYTLPGDRIIARIGKPRGDGHAATLREILTPGPDRVEPPCPHFHACGGCALQHLAADPYARWKRELVVAALHRRDLVVDVAPLWTPPLGERRRAEFVARAVGGKIVLGFHERESHRIVDIDACLLLDPRLTALLGPLRLMLTSLLPAGESVDLKATATETGVDLVVTVPRLRDRLAWTTLAATLDLARLSWRSQPEAVPEPLIEQRAPIVSFDTTRLVLPPGAFLQASPAAEQYMASLVVEQLGGAGKVFDLFAGLGTFAARLAQRGVQVTAVDTAAASLNALHAAVPNLRIETRDLTRRPFNARELKAVDAVMFDPPRAGAREQADALAGSGVPIVMAISCDPSSFARDARTLVDGGYRLTAVTPIDQFPYSPHVELVAVFQA